MIIQDVTTDFQTDSIRIYRFNGIFVVSCDRNDIEKLSNIDFFKAIGCYILEHNSQIYVGQTTNDQDGFSARIKEHLKSKKWWSKLYLIGFLNQKTFTKSHADYIERYFITYLTNRYKVIENRTTGNVSNITYDLKKEADHLINNAIILINSLTSSDIFHREPTYKTQLIDKLDQLLDNGHDIENYHDITTMTPTPNPLLYGYFLKERSQIEYGIVLSRHTNWN